jgi:hypothetical protein
VGARLNQTGKKKNFQFSLALATSTMGLFASKHLAPKEGGRRLIVSGAGENEANGLYVECAELHDSKPQFVYSGRTRGHAPIVLYYSKGDAQWAVRKDAVQLGSTNKHWYVCAWGASSNARNISSYENPMQGEMPPGVGWVVSPKAQKRAMGEAAGDWMTPPPTVAELAAGEPIPVDIAREMAERGIKYAADGE